MVLILTCYENEMHCILKPGLFDEQTQKYGLLVLILELKSTVISCSPKLSHFYNNEEYSMSVGKKLDERHQLSFNCVTSHFLSDEASFLEVSLCLPTLFHFWTVLLLE